MNHHTTPHPIWGVLREQGRYNLVWLAERTGFSHSHVKGVAAGIQRPGPRFRAACARVLGVDETDLFHGGAPCERTSEGDRSNTGSAIDGESTAVVLASVPGPRGGRL